MDPFRSSLSPNTVEVLICTQNWLRSKDSTRPINLREAMDEVKNFELESDNVFMFFSNFFFFLFLLFINSLVFFFFLVIYLFVSYYLYTICFVPPPPTSFKACTKTYCGYKFCSRLIWKVGFFFGLSYLR